MRAACEARIGRIYRAKVATALGARALLAHAPLSILVYQPHRWRVCMVSLAHWFKSVVASLFWYSILGRWRLKDAFNDLYEGQTRSPTFRGIWRNVFGDQYAEEVDPCSFLTLNDLHSLVTHLHLSAGDTLVDLACGRGGTGLWVRARPALTWSAWIWRRWRWRSARPDRGFRIGRQGRVSRGRFFGHRTRRGPFRRRDQHRLAVSRGGQNRLRPRDRPHSQNRSGGSP